MPAMITLKHFSLFEPNIDKLAFKAWPVKLSFDDYQFEIRSENSRFFISGNQPFCINNQKCSISEIIPGDLINFENEFIFFDKKKGDKNTGVFLGKIQVPEDKDKLLIFKLSRKNAAEDYDEIFEFMMRLPEAAKIFVDASATQFMDSQAIQSMMALLKKARGAKRSLFFYNPSQKFISYLKLANIEKKTPVMPSVNPHIDQFIERHSQNTRIHPGAIHFFISDRLNRNIILPETVLLVGRLNPNCGLVLSDNQISRVHALFINTDARLFLMDCHSTNLSFINGQQVAPYCLKPLKNKDLVDFGQSSHFIIEQIGF